jgi:hypothetical protein
MSLEHFPRNEISFNYLFDDRLERFGVAADTETGALIAPDGTATIVQRTDKDYAQFLRNAIAAKFRIELTHVVVEGPSCGDAEFICRWLNAAMESDRLLQKHFEREPEFRTSISRLETQYCIEFALAGTVFIRKWLKDR